VTHLPKTFEECSESNYLSGDGDKFPIVHHNGIIWEKLDYISARKKIYCKIYAELVQATYAYKMIKNLVDRGQSIQICEMDVRPDIITEEVLKVELNNNKQAFGHGYVLAACLMGLTHIFDE